MYCKSVEDVKAVATKSGRYAVWARDKWDRPEWLDLIIFEDDKGNTIRDWFGVPLLPDMTSNMVLCDERLVGCEILPDWRHA